VLKVCLEIRCASYNNEEHAKWQVPSIGAGQDQILSVLSVFLECGLLKKSSKNRKECCTSSEGMLDNIIAGLWLRKSAFSYMW